MAADASFQRNSFTWSLQKLTQRVQEWIEYQFSQPNTAGEVSDPWIWPEWIGRSIFMIGMIVLLVWLMWQLYTIFRPYAAYWRSPFQSTKSIQSSLSPQRSPHYWWKRAQYLHQQRYYQEACHALYMGMLQQLHDTEQIPKNDSYTDGDYWRIIQTLSVQTAVPNPYKLLLDIHEQIVFGDKQTSDEIVLRCQNAYKEIVPL